LGAVRWPAWRRGPERKTPLTPCPLPSGPERAAARVFEVCAVVLSGRGRLGAGSMPCCLRPHAGAQVPVRARGVIRLCWGRRRPQPGSARGLLFCPPRRRSGGPFWGPLGGCLSPT